MRTIITAAIATLATVAVPAAAAEREANVVAVKDGKICVQPSRAQGSDQTGSILPRRECRTREQWEARGVTFNEAALAKKVATR